jgi:hypothetical protein
VRETARERDWRRTPTPADMVLMGAVALLAAALFALQGRGDSPPARVSVTGARGHVELSLGPERRLEVEGPIGISLVETGHGRARIAASPCPHQVCVRRGWIGETGEVAVCVPNRLVLQILGRPSPGQLDGVTR